MWKVRCKQHKLYWKRRKRRSMVWKMNLRIWISYWKFCWNENSNIYAKHLRKIICCDRSFRLNTCQSAIFHKQIYQMRFNSFKEICQVINHVRVLYFGSVLPGILHRLQENARFFFWISLFTRSKVNTFNECSWKDILTFHIENH